MMLFWPVYWMLLWKGRRKAREVLYKKMWKGMEETGVGGGGEYLKEIKTKEGDHKL